MNTSSQNDSVQDIRGVLIQVGGARLLLPNATISEVLSYADPEPVENAPEWLMGRIRWRGWQLPLVSFSRIAGLAEEQGGLGSKVAVLKAQGDRKSVGWGKSVSGRVDLGGRRIHKKKKKSMRTI